MGLKDRIREAAAERRELAAYTREQRSRAAAEQRRAEQLDREARGVLWEVTGYDDNATQTLTIFKDRVECVTHHKMFKVGLSTADQGMEAMPLGAVASCSIERNGPLTSTLTVHGSGNSLRFRGTGVDVQRAQELILWAKSEASSTAPPSRQATAAATEPASQKTCPMCAEDVKAAARICRYCGHAFDPS